MIQNAKIIKTKLGYEDHGILTFKLFLEVEGSNHQVVGGLCLDVYNKDLNKRVASINCGNYIQGILQTLEINNWEDLKGSIICVEKENPHSDILKIGHPIKDKWFIL